MSQAQKVTGYVIVMDLKIRKMYYTINTELPCKESNFTLLLERAFLFPSKELAEIVREQNILDMGEGWNEFMKKENPTFFDRTFKIVALLDD